MKIENISIKEVIPYEKNPRKNEKAIDIVAKSIKEFGFLVPVILDKKNVIVAGHTRIKAAIKLGITEVPAIYTENLTDAQIKAFRIMDNKSSELAEWDYDLLKQELYDLEDTDCFELTGFTGDEITEIWDSDKEATEDGFIEVGAYERAKSKSTVKLGEIYQLGNHRLMCGDATIKEDVNKLMNNQKADMVFTDPPYNVDYEGGFGRQTMANEEKKWSKIKNDKMNSVDWDEFCRSFMARMSENVDGPVYIFMSCKELPTVQKIFIESGGHWQSTLIWKKERFVFGMKDYKSDYEPFIYGWFKNRNWSGSQNETDIWDLSRDKPSDYQHPTQKPIGLSFRAIKNSSKGKNIILDLFGGSGSTLIACEQLDRKCFMMELDPVYCSVIIERWEKLTKKKAVKL